MRIRLMKGRKGEWATETLITERDATAEAATSDPYSNPRILKRILNHNALRALDADLVNHSQRSGTFDPRAVMRVVRVTCLLSRPLVADLRARMQYIFVSDATGNFTNVTLYHNTERELAEL
ncbi:hypothetical protein EVAR_101750_1 [Eumeta japonica]|uniref:Uncharacterized protein n=1 Tax=Eumeta variegata TaxID=151549 RepID=A0A4C1SMZ5_EUMVA|nr:hypothetical protein EVAR_101750_1 [Eumeta japonica]